LQLILMPLVAIYVVAVVIQAWSYVVATKTKKYGRLAEY
jgi:hypothetical protein